MSCFMNGLCGVQDVSTLKLRQAREEPVLAPFIVLKVVEDKPSSIVMTVLDAFADFLNAKKIAAKSAQNNSQISVGNTSYPAIIKSFSFGASNGAGCDIEIVDEEAGSFAAIFEKIDRGGRATGNYITVRFGWIANSCGAGIQGPPPAPTTSDPYSDTALSSPEFKFQVIKTSLTFTGGMVHYSLNCVDTLQQIQQNNANGVFENCSLKEAIQKHLGEANLQVQFLKFTGVTQQDKFVFDTTNSAGAQANNDNGPTRARWECGGRQGLACIMEWLRSCMAADPQCPRGIRMLYEPTNPPRLLCIADTTSRVTSNFDSSKYNIGTYVVNGGNCSPVIRFQPSIQWATGGNAYAATGTSGAASGGTTVSAGPSACINTPQDMPHLYGQGTDSMKPGWPLSIVMQDGELEARINQAYRYSYNATYMNNLANVVFGGGITAELTIQGNPSLSQPIYMIGKFVNILVINPLTVSAGCKWSNQIEACNAILSKQNWLIEGVHHNIQPGSYTTTLKVRMLSPGAEISAKVPDGQTNTK